MSCDDELVLGATLRLIGVARQRMPWYAGDFAPIRTDQLSELLRRSTCVVEIFPFQSNVPAMALPPFKGVYPIFVAQNAPRTDRMFSIRHELAHVLAGEADRARLLSPGGYMTPSERAADTFAVADLVPGWFLRVLRKDRLAWRKVRAEIRGAIATYAEDWPDDRLDDRATLRLRLFRECGI